MSRLAVIGGTGVYSLSELTNVSTKIVDTPYGKPSSEYTLGEIEDVEIIFLPRHAHNHSIPPHKINYRANIWGLHNLNVTHIIAFASVGGIHPDIPPERIVIPNQIIDYTHGRQHTFFDEDLNKAVHIDFTQPYCEELRNILITSAKDAKIAVREKGTYAAVQGPRLETAAEINRLEKDGCDIVGMTGMPEAVLAKELEMCYATCALCVNWAAGRSEKEINMADIQNSVDRGMRAFQKILMSASEHF